MKNLMVRFWREEQGQDLIEYTLLLAFSVFGRRCAVHPHGWQHRSNLDLHQQHGVVRCERCREGAGQS